MAAIRASRAKWRAERDVIQTRPLSAIGFRHGFRASPDIVSGIRKDFSSRKKRPIMAAGRFRPKGGRP